jgi:hypothetical protein
MSFDFEEWLREIETRPTMPAGIRGIRDDVHRLVQAIKGERHMSPEEMESIKNRLAVLEEYGHLK